jgi:tRNA-Thr(GGU) m(6)t(6)A37 methyltransferase TsaA
MRSEQPPSRPPPLTLEPIGIVRSPFVDRMSAPRQPRAAEGVQGTIELWPQSGFEHALEDLASFRFIWVLFWFHKNQTFRPKVLPPRSERRRGVFATRSPYRPNPIGMSAVELLGVEKLRLSVQNLDILDGTPVLDLKPYVPYTDSIPGADNGWLDEVARPKDPIPNHQVEFAARAREQLAYLERHAIVLGPAIEEVLRLGATPHPYRRIKPNGDGWVLAYKAWRVDFTVSGSNVTVLGVRSGYRPSVLHTSYEPDVVLHREFTAAFDRGP